MYVLTRQAINVWRNIQARSSLLPWKSKVHITHSELVSVALLSNMQGPCAVLKSFAT